MRSIIISNSPHNSHWVSIEKVKKRNLQSMTSFNNERQLQANSIRNFSQNFKIYRLFPKSCFLLRTQRDKVLVRYFFVFIFSSGKMCLAADSNSASSEHIFCVCVHWCENIKILEIPSLFYCLSYNSLNCSFFILISFLAIKYFLNNKQKQRGRRRREILWNAHRKFQIVNQSYSLNSKVK